METKWTPGPWVWVKNPPLHDGSRADTIYGEDGRGDYVADVYLNYLLATRNAERFEANAHLIAAAPDLYAALDVLSQTMAEMLTAGDVIRNISARGVDSLWGEVNTARAALAKARGEA